MAVTVTVLFRDWMKLIAVKLCVSLGLVVMNLLVLLQEVVALYCTQTNSGYVSRKVLYQNSKRWNYHILHYYTPKFTEYIELHNTFMSR